MTAEERKVFANEAERAWEEPTVQAVYEELLGNLGIERRGFVDYGFAKLASYVAQTARAHALGIPIAALKASAEEHQEFVADLTRTTLLAGHPVFRVE